MVEELTVTDDGNCKNESVVNIVRWESWPLTISERIEDFDGLFVCHGGEG